MYFGGGGNLANPYNTRLAMSLFGSQRDPNNGTVAGGVGSVLQKALMGYMAGQDAQQQQQAQQVLQQAGQAMAGNYTAQGPMPGSGDAGYQVKGQPNTRLAASLLMQNPLTANMGMQMFAAEQARALENEQWQNRFAQQDAAANARLDKQLAAQEAARQDDRAFRKDMLNAQIAGRAPNTITLGDGVYTLNPNGTLGNRLGDAPERGNSGSPFYAVPTGAGVMMVDRRTGMAQNMGVNEQGDLVPRGKPFQPMMDQNGMPTAIPSPTGGNGAGQLPPQTGVTPSGMPGDGGQARPLLSPGIDPAANAAKTTAVEDAKARVESNWQANKAYSGLVEAIQPLDRLAATASSLMASPALDRITGLNSYIPNMPGGAAADAEAQMKTLRSQIAQNVLQMYRNMSQTGGAVGQVSNAEQELFQNNLAALDQAQSPEQFRKSMQQILQFVQGSKERLRQAYERQYLMPGTVPVPSMGGAPAQSPSAPPSAGGPMPGVRFLGFEG